MTHDRGVCQACDRTLALRKDGKVQAHRIRDVYPARTCPGADQVPRAPGKEGHLR